jgi:hypothetical protein
MIPRYDSYGYGYPYSHDAFWPVAACDCEGGLPFRSVELGESTTGPFLGNQVSRH